MSSLCAISTSCRQLYILTVPVLYQRINLNNKNHGCPGLLLRLTTKGTKLPNFIRQITIESGNWVNDFALQQLIELFSNLTQLETLTWSQNYDIPDGILQSLHKYSPKSRLIVKAEIPFLYPQSVPHQCTGFSSPNLYSLDARIPAEPQSRRIAKLSLFNILRSSTNLRKLNLTQDNGGCVVFGFDPSLEIDLNVRVGDQLPQLEELSFPIFSITDMSRWGNMGGWSKLRVLKLSRNAWALEAFNGRVPCLRSLTLNIPWSQLESLEWRLSQMSILEELVLNGDGMRFPFNLLAANSDTLRTLTVHAPEPYSPKMRPDIPISDIWRLNETCPKLKFLSVDINRDGQWVSSLPQFLFMILSIIYKESIEPITNQSLAA
jgi:hypothetical protein